jgi:hypothetical protein
MIPSRQPLARIPAASGAVNPAAAEVLWAAAIGLANAIRADSGGGTAIASAFGPEWDPLVGRWFGDAGMPDAFAFATFRYELGGRVLMRHGLAREPGCGARHEDLMTIYPAADGGAEAMYHDRDGHVIHYMATWSYDRSSLVMLSVPEPGAPRYRLTWHLDEPDTLETCLEIAPADGDVFVHHSGGMLARSGA